MGRRSFVSIWCRFSLLGMIPEHSRAVLIYGVGVGNERNPLIGMHLTAVAKKIFLLRGVGKGSTEIE